jgi:PhnB protein
MLIQPYLFFDGRYEEAFEFYRSALGAEVLMMMRYKENPEPHSESQAPPGSENKIMHLRMRIGDSEVMASDGLCQGAPDFKGFSLSYKARSESEADQVFARMAEGGQVQMPLTKTFFSPRFGMVADRFGVSWMIIVDA